MYISRLIFHEQVRMTSSYSTPTCRLQLFPSASRPRTIFFYAIPPDLRTYRAGWTTFAIVLQIIGSFISGIYVDSIASHIYRESTGLWYVDWCWLLFELIYRVRANYYSRAPDRVCRVASQAARPKMEDLAAFYVRGYWAFSICADYSCLQHISVRPARSAGGFKILRLWGPSNSGWGAVLNGPFTVKSELALIFSLTSDRHASPSHGNPSALISWAISPDISRFGRHPHGYSFLWDFGCISVELR